MSSQDELERLEAELAGVEEQLALERAEVTRLRAGAEKLTDVRRHGPVRTFVTGAVTGALVALSLALALVVWP